VRSERAQPHQTPPARKTAAGSSYIPLRTGCGQLQHRWELPRHRSRAFFAPRNAIKIDFMTLNNLCLALGCVMACTKQCLTQSGDTADQLTQADILAGPSLARRAPGASSASRAHCKQHVDSEPPFGTFLMATNLPTWTSTHSMKPQLHTTLQQDSAPLVCTVCHCSQDCQTLLCKPYSTLKATAWRTIIRQV
jgi:hypothetical protein